ncbi:MAG TPA: PQQ-dependent sugar dehydrogenase [Vicinamibacterales bacterium]|nr:PQQ-dependent sugar dehydrogenase [Vicinamibacterales bacterium]
MSQLLRFLVISGTLAVAPNAFAQLRATTYVSGLAAPLDFVQDPSDAAVQYVVQQAGRIRVISGGTLLPTDFLDLSGVVSCCGERGLLGLAFPPDYASSGRFYVNFTNAAGHTVVARYKRSTGNRLVAEASSRFDLRWGGPSGNRYIVQDFSNHNGGHMVFGPDGYLYIGMGDGGSGNDPLRRAQDPAQWLGKMLRIDVSVADAHPEGYVVPADNPFVGTTAKPEIWSFGWRNPWRFSFDDRPGGSNAMLIADVGQSAWEEIDHEPAGRGGRNYGWVRREGAHETGLQGPVAGAPATLTDPIFEYSHSEGSSITGGFVYRGTALGNAMRGRYFFADFVRGRVWSIQLNVNSVTLEATASDLREHTAALGGSSLGLISSFGQDASGELYIVNYNGSIFKIVSDAYNGPNLKADLNRDGWSDIYWRHSGTGENRVWRTSSASVAGTSMLSPVPDTRWAMSGIADFTSDGHADILWRNTTTGENVVWQMNGASYVQTIWLNTVPNLNWSIVAAGDVNGDNHSDIIWRNTATGENVVWYMFNTGYQTTGWFNTVTDMRWSLITAADFNGDRKLDFLWRNTVTGENVVWLLDGTAYQTTLWLDTVTDMRWDLVAAADFTGEGKADLVWRNNITGENVIWALDGVLYLNTLWLPTESDQAWHVRQ